MIVRVVGLSDLGTRLAGTNGSGWMEAEAEDAEGIIIVFVLLVGGIGVVGYVCWTCTVRDLSLCYVVWIRVSDIFHRMIALA